MNESGGVALLPFYHSSFIIHRSGNGQAISTGKRWEPILAGRAPTPAKARFFFSGGLKPDRQTRDARRNSHLGFPRTKFQEPNSNLLIGSWFLEFGSSDYHSPFTY